MKQIFLAFTAFIFYSNMAKAQNEPEEKFKPHSSLGIAIGHTHVRNK